MEARITIRMDNAAFEAPNGDEISRCLSELAAKVKGGNWNQYDAWAIFDANGNNVGSLEFRV